MAMTSCYVALGTSSAGKAPTRAGGDLIASINEAMLKHGAEIEVFEGERPRKAVRIDHVRDEFMRRHSVGESADPTGTKRKAYGRALDKVLKDQLYATRTVGSVEYIWPIQV
jgi:hypothetical protein